ncbi:MAG: DEAD/DEAH box helicase [Rickettsiales bacterium]|nr:DEAD/DEAH box helicase [Rickettsiales bacterium]
MTTFDSLALPAPLRASLARMGFTTPTPVQAEAIPHAMEGRDILGTAQTGTGKTGAFGIPLIAKLIANSRGSALIMTPTRELAAQVVAVINDLLGANNPIKSALLIGGEPMGGQLRQLRGRPRIIIGTPGRINDHLEQGNLMLMETHTLVLDETDRMLDMGFAVQIDRIVKFLPKQRQTMLFSATLPPEILKLSEKYLNNPVRVAVGSPNVVAKKIQQEVIRTTPEGKYSELVKQLDERAGSIIVFVKTKHSAEKMADKLCKEQFGADAIHGDLVQRKRDRVISSFREKRFRILVATDIAARGLDIPHIEHVINYDMPHAPEDYIHRIGRTARADAEGAAVSLVVPEDEKRWYAIQRLLNPGAPAPAGGARGGRGAGGGQGAKSGAAKRRRPRNRPSGSPKMAA